MKSSSFDAVVKTARRVEEATATFRERLRKPYRVPLPAAPTAQGYADELAKLAPPDDATNLELIRDWLLRVLSHTFFSVVTVIWFVVLACLFIVFAGCFLYIFRWGKATCDYWQERMTQGLSAIFTYSVLAPYPWRLAITLQLCSRRCASSPVGVDFYGRPTEMVFFHIPRNTRVAIAVLLQVNTWVQLLHQTFHIVWNNVQTYQAPAHQVLFILTIAGSFVPGAVGALIQLMAESNLYEQHPGRFPPNLITVYRQLQQRHQQGESYGALLREIFRGKPQPATASTPLLAAAGPASGPPTAK